jgi:hypothetical protein
MWYRALLSADQLSAGCVAAIRLQFATAIQLPASPPARVCSSRAVQSLTRPSLRTLFRKAGGDAVYFSPASVAAVREMIGHYNAQPSPPLARGRAVLLVGDPSDWDLLPRRTR